MALTASIISYYKLNGNALDELGLYSGAQTDIIYSENSGFIKQGAFCNGVSSKIYCSSMSQLRSQSKFSISFWYYPVDVSGLQTVCNQWFSTSQALFIILNNAKKIRFYIANATGDAGVNRVETTNDVITAGQWYHVACVFDGTLTGNTNRAKIYLNGVSQSLTAVGTIPASTTASTSQFQMIGRSDNTLFFSGYLDELGVWQKALTSTEVTDLYNLGSGLTYPFDGSIKASAQVIQLCDWMLASTYYRFSTARRNAITAIRSSAIAGTSISQHDWNQFINIAQPILTPYGSNTSLTT